ncbi:MAG: DNA-3-methyladenine glycosylase [Bacteroidetes bacterium]|nr:DNA-3-methyladenine glycosylase [Bacteroidota bacterium]
MHYCINAVTETQGVESTVLLRSAEPITDIEVVSARRGINCKETESCRGPGKLARAFGITDKSDGISLCMSTKATVYRFVCRNYSLQNFQLIRPK